MAPVLLFFRNRCRLCGACVAVCPVGAHQIAGGQHRIRRSRCGHCGRCVRACPTTVPGRAMAGALALPVFRATPGEVWRRLHPQLTLLRRIGGLTVCGGEPLCQHHAVGELAGLCRAARVHVAVETSGSFPQRRFAALVDKVDCWLFGLRPTSCGAGDHHQEARLSTVRRNLSFLARRASARIIVRTPIIPSLTDGLDSLMTVADLMRENGLSELELLPMNRHTSHYYNAMGQPFPLKALSPPSAERLAIIQAFFAERGVQARLVP